MMKAWHFLKHLNCTPAAASLSLHLLRSSSFSLSRYSPSLFFLSVHTTASDHWPARGQVKNGHANFSTASSSLAVHSMASPVPVPANYVSVLVRCHKDNSDMLAEALLSFGASSVTMNEDDVCSDTDEICVSSIFLEGEDINMSISHAADSIGLKEIPRYEVKIIEEDDWMKGAQESFHPVEVTEGLWVVPKWITPPDIQAMNIILNPGLAFGTGDHPTTKLCLLLLHDCIKGGEHILDYGTGTGILAIAALKFGAAFAVGVDIDSQAIASASENATLNNIGPDKLQLHLIASQTSSSCRDDWPSRVVEGENAFEIDRVTHKDKYDVVIANILLNPLLNLADQIIFSAKPGAIIGLSGILSEQVQNILQKYSLFLEGIDVSKMDDWACVSGRKRKNIDIC
ncbi:hypothetical protein HN51_011645 [Arachis hypogaea]|uniref:ETFB lysine methyltransferase n=3 Tax=Arachis TaxID=3817 RepID=A0A445DYD0_ARAHY|nr:uncharacterized protein LOC107478515 isoform X1 [Arachis duranensis]XP_025688157.1 uncharacterized protein LOC112790127 isoform X1 [Arachis hypogaea]QHO56982.1 Ribosomal protein methyltransferase [Arachis hypogaea]RYR68147.1 hypothetical protein Ahy_A03g014616 [Arachis hypogaea]